MIKSAQKDILDVIKILLRIHLGIKLTQIGILDQLVDINFLKINQALNKVIVLINDENDIKMKLPYRMFKRIIIPSLVEMIIFKQRKCRASARIISS